MRSLVTVALIAAAPSIPRPTGACEPRASDGGPLRADPAHASDAVVPSPTMASAQVLAGEDSVGCATVCGGAFAEVQLDVEATDDRTPAERLGYQLSVIDGEPPPGLVVPADVRVPDGGSFFLPFATSFRGEFRFDLELRAVDLNGNVGPATVITVTGSA